MRFKSKLLVSLVLVVAVVMLSGCNLFKQPSGKYTGIVTMSDGETPVPADVYVGGEKYKTVGEDGKFEITLKPGTYKIYAEYMGVKSEEVTLNATSQGGSVVVKIDGLGKVSGTLKTADGTALANQAFKISNVDVTTDANGKYDLVLTYNKHTVLVNYKGYEYSKEQTFQAGTNDIVVDDVKQLTLTLKHKDGSALSGAKATVKVGGFTHQVTADAEGKITFLGVAKPGTLTADISGDLKMPVAEEFSKFQNTVNVDFATATEAEFDVADPDFVDTFDDGLDNWIEGEDWILNDWQETIKGAVVQNGVLTRSEYVPHKTSGVKLKDVEITDAAVVIKVRLLSEREGQNAGMRVHLRNDSDKFNHGYGLNFTATSCLMENWLGNLGSKGAAVKVDPGKGQFPGDDIWCTVTLTLVDHTMRVYVDGNPVLVNPEKGPLVFVEENEEWQHDSGYLWIEYSGALEIDEVRVYHL